MHPNLSKIEPCYNDGSLNKLNIVNFLLLFSPLNRHLTSIHPPSLCTNTPSLQAMGLTIAPVTLSYRVYSPHENQGQGQGQGQGGSTVRFINCNVVQDSSRSAEILPGDLFVGINGVPLVDENTPAATTTEVSDICIPTYIHTYTYIYKPYTYITYTYTYTYIYIHVPSPHRLFAII